MCKELIKLLCLYTAHAEFRIFREVYILAVLVRVLSISIVIIIIVLHTFSYSYILPYILILCYRHNNIICSPLVIHHLCEALKIMYVCMYHVAISIFISLINRTTCHVCIFCQVATTFFLTDFWIKCFYSSKLVFDLTLAAKLEITLTSWWSGANHNSWGS